MIIWGGWSGFLRLGDGAIYYPGNDVWEGVSDINAPGARDRHIGLWTGLEFLTCSGHAGDDEFHEDIYSYFPTRTLQMWQRK